MKNYNAHNAHSADCAQRLLSFLAVVLLLLPAFAARKQKQKAETKQPTDTLTQQERRRYSYFFLEAARQENAGNYDAAFDLLNLCQRLDSNATEVYFMRALYLSDLKKDTLALRDLLHAARLDPDNASYQERVAQYYINLKDYASAIPAYEELSRRSRDRDDVLHILLQLYQQQKDYPHMLSTLDRLEQLNGPSEAIALSRMRVYEMKGDTKNACRTLRTLSDQHPNDVNYRVMLGNWYMQHEQQKEAYKIFAAALKDEPDNEFALSSMYDYYRATEQTDLAGDLFARLIASRKVSSETKATLLQQALRDNESAGGDSLQMLQLLDKAMDANPQDSVIAQLNAAYYIMKKMPAQDIRRALRNVLRISPESASARLELIQVALQDNDTTPWRPAVCDSIIKECEPATLYNPDELGFYYYLGLAHYMKSDTLEALKAFKRGTRVINERSNKDIASDFYAIMGDLYFGQKQKREAFAAYDSCLQYKPDNVGCLNNYAYYLSLENENLPKAEAMSLKTIKAEPNNATYLDTYAWILFLEQRYAEAKIYADQCLKNDSSLSAVVLEHAGDIYANCGDIQKALDFWQQAKAKGGSDNEALLERKIKLKKYVKE